MKNATDVISFDEITLDKEGFSYWGTEHIDFKVCASNVKEDLGPGYVGWRDITSTPPYVEFAGDKRVIVTFKKPSWFDNLLGRDPFHAFQVKLKEFGWRTFDRS